MDYFYKSNLLKEFISSKKSEGYKFAFYGAGRGATNTFHQIKLENIEIEIDFIIDNDINKKGSSFNNVKVIHIDDFLLIEEDYVVIYTIVDDKYCKKIEDIFKTKRNAYALIKIDTHNPDLVHLLERARLSDSELNKYYLNEICVGRIPERKQIEYKYINNNIVKLDMQSEGLNIENGVRVTRNKIENFCYSKRVLMFGDSRLFNALLDEFTIASFLQKKLGNIADVINYSTQAQNIFEIKKMIEEYEFKKDDIVIINNVVLKVPDYNIYDIYSEDELAHIYIEPFLEIKEYLNKLGIKMIFLWTPNIREIKTHGRFETEIINALEQLDTFSYPNFGKISHRKECLRLFLRVEKIIELCNLNGITICNSLPAFDNKNFDAFIDSAHFTTKGNELIAEAVYNMLDKIYMNKSFLSYVTISKKFTEQICFNTYFNKGELTVYLDMLKDLSNDKSENSGAIVMNANPFTKGHLYLIENSAKQVDVLYVFVVEENKSFFKFEDRFELVKRGVSHLENVIVLPSGRAIISSITMPEYFEKETKSEQILDASNDIAMFGNLIAPACKIKKRFVGNEPFCYITKQYNEQMEKKLKEYDIELVIVDRVCAEGDIISATKVRNFLKDRDFIS